MTCDVTIKVECPECKGTGVYSGMYEPSGTGTICTKCKGTGGFNYTYTPFAGRRDSRNHLVVVPEMSSKIGQLVRTTALDQDTHGLSWAEIAAQRWGVEGTIYDERPATFGGLLYLVGHADGPPVWYGQTELEYLK